MSVNLDDNRAPAWWAELIDQKNQLPAFDQETPEDIYFAAHRLYQEGKYEEAVPFFLLLTKVVPEKSKYWKGLGAALQMTKKYTEAIECYFWAQRLLNQDPDPYLCVYAADCYIALGDTEQALILLKNASKCAKNDKKIINHISFMQEQWSNSIK